ncbi:uncharacterized protein RBU33_005978 isoform 2-T2 [Hipposideros larvatus]
MPREMAAIKVSLRELADLAIGTPEVGAVNFTALHKLIVAILKNLHLQDTVVDIQSLSPDQSHFFEAPQPSLSAVQVPVSKEKQKTSVARTPAPMPEGGVARTPAQMLDSDLARTPAQMLDSDLARTPAQMLDSDLARTPAQMLDSDLARTPAQMLDSDLARTPALTLESQVKDLGGQVHDLDRQFKTMESQVQGILTHVQHVTAMASELDVDTPEWLGEQEMATPMPEMAKLMPKMATSMPDKAQMGLKIRKDRPQAMEMLQNVMEDVKTLKEAHEKAQGKVQELPELTSQKLLQRIEEVEKKLRDREEFLVMSASFVGKGPQEVGEGWVPAAWPSVGLFQTPILDVCVPPG